MAPNSTIARRHRGPIAQAPSEYPSTAMDERVLAERLMTYDTSTPDGLRAAAGFVKGWLEARDIEVAARDHDGLPVMLADVGAARRART